MSLSQRVAARISDGRHTPLVLAGIALSLAAFLGACQGVPTPRTPDANSLDLTIAASDHAELPQNFDDGQSSLFVLQKVPSGSPQARKAN